MTEDERKYAEQELSRLKTAYLFLSQPGRAKRERLSCAMFLRALGLPFSEAELIAVPNDGPLEYIDVKFQDARFQVREFLTKGRRRQAEWKAEIRRYEQALQSWRSVPISELVDAPHRPTRSPMSYSEVYARLAEALGEKASQYGEKTCAALDALGVIQLTGRYLDQASPPADPTELL